jgi:hypothetical protein
MTTISVRLTPGEAERVDALVNDITSACHGALVAPFTRSEIFRAILNNACEFPAATAQLTAQHLGEPWPKKLRK